ncbi:acyltransferase family protein [Marinicrinis sediminis]|uniref:Acyltransferase family protein n=1 Tax=Marinicrinis sediminis TaxID=1652465 RepID=A0ABW5RDR1_9BACL
MPRLLIQVRYFLIFFVVTANLWEQAASESALIAYLYEWIYLFHIPLFVLVTGYFAGKESFLKLSFIILFPYVVFQSVYCLLDVVFFHMHEGAYSFFIPYSFLWFLFSHFFWRLLLAAVIRYRFPFVLAICTSCLIGMVPDTGGWFSLQKMIYFFPFYLLGAQLASNVGAGKTMSRVLAFLREKPPIWLRWILFLLISVLFLTVTEVAWLSGQWNYEQLGLSIGSGVFMRVAMYGIQLLTGVCLIAIVRGQSDFLHDSGKQTFFVYLLHASVVKTILALQLLQPLSPVMMAWMVPAAAWLLVWLLSRPQVKRSLHYVVEPGWLFQLGLKWRHGDEAKPRGV